MSFFIIIIEIVLDIVPVDIDTPVHTCTESREDDFASIGIISDTARDTSEWSIRLYNLRIHLVRIVYSTMMHNEWLCFPMTYNVGMLHHQDD